jgi:hypothetical protein
MCFFYYRREILGKHVDFRQDPQGTQGMCNSVLLPILIPILKRGFCSQLEIVGELTDVA